MRYALIAIALAACTDGPAVTLPDPIVQTHVDTYELYGRRASRFPSILIP